MKRWIARIGGLAVIVALGLFLWNYFFPSPEKVIREGLAEVARLASFASGESPVAQLQNSMKIGSHCTDDIEITIEASGARHTLAGRDELIQQLMFARNHIPGLSLEFLDVIVAFAPNKKAAVVNLTIKGRIGGERDMLVQECRFSMKKVGRNWFIRKIETIKTLS